jgi:tetratricopeptide (TPR) repeat protein
MSSSPSPEGYPGNPSLPREVREKILSTFRHTLNLYHQGKTDDCLIGCDFILKMDPRFAPARKLMEKAKNPAADVDVAELEALVTATPTRQERVAAVDPGRLLVRAVESCNARDFDAAIAAAEQVLAVLPGNRDALKILDKAESKKAAQPAFDASRQRALAALDSDRLQDARREFQQMRDLDPDHPAVALLERRLGSLPASTAVAPPATSSSQSGPAPEQDVDIQFDLSGPEPLPFDSLSAEKEEPEIRFDERAPESPPEPATGEGGLEALSLDSLSLDAPGAPSSPLRVDLDATNPRAVPTSTPPAPPPGSPADLWSAPAGRPDPEGVPREPVPSAPERAPAPPPPPPPRELAPLEEEDAGAAEQEIASLLNQGDEAEQHGDRQQAIEVWSRIFLIDINNTEAVDRIERARQLMAEGNRVLSDSLKTGRAKFEAGDLAAARESFLQVLGNDPNEPTARFYIDRIDQELARTGSSSGTAPAAPPVGTAHASPAPAPASSEALGRTPAPARSLRLRLPPRALGLIGVALVATAIGVYVVFKTPKPPATRPAPSALTGSLAHAKELVGSGNTAEARKELLRIPRDSSDYAEARKMLADLSQVSVLVSGAPAVAGGPAPPSSGAPAATPGANDPGRLRAAGEKALAEKRYIEALKNLNLAAPTFRNDPTFAQAVGVAADKVSAIAPAIKLYNEGEYETAIPVLWRIYQEDRENQDARSYLLRCYYNEGITQLQNGLYPKAMKSFDEALALEPTDAEVIRHRRFAEHYMKGDLDLMGRIYVRHLNRRP